MSVLPTGRPLRQVVPDYEELLRDPAGYLHEGPVTIGARQMYGLAGLFGIAAAACVGYSIWEGEIDPEPVALGVGLAMGAMVWLGWSLLMRGHTLTLLPGGVEFAFRETTVWCPWGLFNGGGVPYVPDADNPRVGLTLPIDPAAIPHVVLRRDGSPVAHGVEVKARQFYITGGNEVVLPARYEARADELGALLLHLGGRLGAALPREAPPPEAYPADDFDAATLPEPDAAGWFTAHLTHLAFPPHRCCSCLGEAENTMTWYVDARGDWVQQLFTQQVRGAQIHIPVCETCAAAIRSRQKAVSTAAMAAGAAVWAAVALTAASLANVRDRTELLLLGVLTAAVGALLGFVAGVRLGRRLPVQIRNYSPARGTVSIRFLNPHYGAAVWDLMRERLRTARRPRR
jgi:hypothetical protein